MSKRSRSKRAVQQGKDAVQPANETEGKQPNQNERKGGTR